MKFSEGESPETRFDKGGSIMGEADRPAFTLKSRKQSIVPVLVSVPHAGRDYPSEILAEMRDPEYACLRLEDRYIDEVAERLAEITGISLLVALAPRAMLDLNRARDDVDWDMVEGPKPHPVRHSQANRRARSGLGLVPRRLPGFGEIWRSRLKRAELDQRISGIHRPYHDATARELARLRDEWGAALLVDLHSMPPLRPTQAQPQPPQYVLGDRFGTSCDAHLRDRAYRYLEMRGRSVAHNRPYAGGYVLDTHASPALGIHALQVEVCRTTYLDSGLSQPSARINQVAKLLSGLVLDLGDAVAAMGRASEFPQAAE